MLTGNPSRKKMTKQCPAAMASALRVASSTSSGSLPVRRTNRGPEASQKASPNRSDELVPAIASCRSSTVLMKCACPITTLKSSGLSPGTTSQESVVVVTRTCCHSQATATVERAPAANDENIVGYSDTVTPDFRVPALLPGTGWCWSLGHPSHPRAWG